MRIYGITPSIGYTHGATIWVLASTAGNAVAAVQATNPKIPGGWLARDFPVMRVTGFRTNLPLIIAN